MERKPLLTDDELDKLEALARPMRQIANHNRTMLSSDMTVADEIDHQHTLRSGVWI